MIAGTRRKLERRTKMGYDNVIIHVGEFGRYQRRIFLVLILPAISCAFHKMGGVFLAARADFRCLLPRENPENADFQLSPNITNTTYPWDHETKTWPQCEEYNFDLVDPYNANLKENISSVPSIVKCDSFVYDKTHYIQTVTTEWNLVCDDAWLKTLSDSLFMLGDMPGVVIFGGLSDKFGRKTTLIWGSVMQLVCGLLVAVSPNLYFYMILRVLVGTTTSGLFIIAFVTVMEMVSPQKRMAVGIDLNLAFTTGYILSSGIAYFIRKWRILQMAFAIPTIILLTLSWSLSESARWLLTKGRVEEAKDILEKISSENGIKLSRDTLDGLLAEDNETGLIFDKPSVIDLLKYPNLRKKSLLLFFIWFMNSIIYYGLSLNTSHLEGNDYLNFMFAAAVEVPAFIFLRLTLDKWGRKLLMCGGMFVAGMSLLATLLVPLSMSWLVKVSAMIGKFAITSAWGAVYISTAEQYPTSIRNVGVGACSAAARIGGAVAPYINYLFEISTYLPFVVLGIASVIAGLLTLLLPETLNKELPESIQHTEKLARSITKAKEDIE